LFDIPNPSLKFLYLVCLFNHIVNAPQGVLSPLGREGCLLEGKIPYGRFGHAIVRLGDINGDNLEGTAKHNMYMLPSVYHSPHA